MKEADRLFNEYVQSLNKRSNHEIFQLLSEECIKNTHRTNDIFTKTIRTEYAAVQILAERLTVNESMILLSNFIRQNDFSNEQNEQEINLFLICCVLINQSHHFDIPIQEIRKWITDAHLENELLNDLILNLEANQ